MNQEPGDQGLRLCVINIDYVLSAHVNIDFAHYAFASFYYSVLYTGYVTMPNQGISN